MSKRAIGCFHIPLLSAILYPMKHRPNLSSFDTLSQIEKRAVILLGFRWRDQSRLDKTIAEMAKIRARLSAKTGKHSDGTAAIRRFRDSR